MFKRKILYVAFGAILWLLASVRKKVKMFLFENPMA